MTIKVFFYKVRGKLASLLMRYLSDKVYLEWIFAQYMGYPLNLENPQTFCEKLNWLKLYGVKPEFTMMVDKAAVKEYVASLIGEEYIIHTYGIWKNVEDINWDILPNCFVIKCTHDSGGVVVCSDKSKLDIKVAEAKLDRGLKKNFSDLWKEKPYYDVKPQIIAEQYLENYDENGNRQYGDLIDYKFFCFNGEPKYCQVIRDRRSIETIDFYDMDWIHQEFVGLNPVARNGHTPVARPRKLEEMKDICCKLSKNIPFVRIDLYYTNDKIYFGEITFYPASGLGVFTPRAWDKKLGDLIKL